MFPFDQTRISIEASIVSSGVDSIHEPPPSSIETELSLAQRRVSNLRDRFFSPAPFIEGETAAVFLDKGPSLGGAAHLCISPQKLRPLEQSQKSPSKEVDAKPKRKIGCGLRLSMPDDFQKESSKTCGSFVQHEEESPSKKFIAHGAECVRPLSIKPSLAKRVLPRHLTVEVHPSIGDDESRADPFCPPVNRWIGQRDVTLSQWVEKICCSFTNDTMGKDRVRPSWVYGSKGVCGSYFALDDSQKILGVVKPADEEPGGENATGELMGLKEAIQPTTATLREVLAYRLQPELVPPTVLMDLTSSQFHNRATKRCSVQMFVENDGVVGSLEESTRHSLSPLLGPIAFLDLLFANSDRNSGNLLVKKTQQGVQSMIPIDHGCILPDNLASGANFFWYPYLDPNQKFDDKIIGKIAALDFERLSLEVVQLDLGDEVLNALFVTTLLLKRLHQTVAIRDIAMYYISEPKNWEQSKSLMFSILRLAALRSKILIHPENFSSGRIPVEILTNCLEEVVDFIESQRESVTQFLKQANFDPQAAREFTEKRYENPHQKIHLALECTRKLFEEKFCRILEKGESALDIQQSLLTNSWQIEAEVRIQAALQERIENPHLEYPQPEAIF